MVKTNNHVNDIDTCSKAMHNKKERNMSKKKKMTNCFVTKNYGQFKKTKGNRPISLTHVEKIKKAIAHKDLKLPIIVTKKNEIRDGHHTFQARKDLGLEIYYIVLDSNDAYDMALLNSNKSGWIYSDYLNFFCTYQRKDYMILKSKVKQYEMPIQEAVAIFNNEVSLRSSTMDDFKEGRFKIQPGALASFDRIAQEMTYINNVLDESKGLKRGFIRAYLVADKCPKWDFARFKTAMKSKGAKLLGAISTEDYVNKFQNIFNSGLTADKKIKLSRFFEDKEFETTNSVTIN